MDDKTLKKLKDSLNILIPDNDTEIRKLTDLTDSQNPAIRELCEAVELISRLSKGERA